MANVGSINWGDFKQEIIDFNGGNSSQSFIETANFYSTLYYNTIQNATLINGNAILPLPSSKLLLYNGFISLFNSSFALQSGSITPQFTLTLTNSIIAFWMLQTFDGSIPILPANSPAIPILPAIVTLGGIGGGITSPLNLSIFAAFNTGTNDGFANGLTIALRAHALTIQGNYSGLITSPPPILPVPVVVPWFGIN